MSYYIANVFALYNRTALMITAVTVSLVSMETAVRQISMTVPVMTCVRMEELAGYVCNIAEN